MLPFHPNQQFTTKYTLIEKIGVGGFAEVWKAKRDNGFVQAIKIFTNLDQEGSQLAQKEFERVFNLNHPNLLKSSDYGVFKGHPYLVMPYCSRGNALKKAGKLSEKALLKALEDIASALAFLHGLDDFILHQDIKPDNFLIDNQGNYLLADFGISRKLQKSLTKSIVQNRRTEKIAGNKKSGTTPPSYRPPEFFNPDFETRKPIKASEIWALGASFYELALNELPFGEYGGLVQKQGTNTPNLPTNRFSKEFNELLNWCLQLEPWNRPTAKKLYEVVSTYNREGIWLLPSLSVSSPQLTVATTAPQKNNPLRWIAILGILLFGLYGGYVLYNNYTSIKSNLNDNTTISEEVDTLTSKQETDDKSEAPKNIPDGDNGNTITYNKELPPKTTNKEEPPVNKDNQTGNQSAPNDTEPIIRGTKLSCMGLLNKIEDKLNQNELATAEQLLENNRDLYVDCKTQFEKLSIKLQKRKIDNGYGSNSTTTQKEDANNIEQAAQLLKQGEKAMEQQDCAKAASIFRQVLNFNYKVEITKQKLKVADKCVQEQEIIPIKPEVSIPTLKDIKATEVIEEETAKPKAKKITMEASKMESTYIYYFGEGLDAEEVIGKKPDSQEVSKEESGNYQIHIDEKKEKITFDHNPKFIFYIQHKEKGVNQILYRAKDKAGVDVTLKVDELNKFLYIIGSKPRKKTKKSIKFKAIRFALD